MSKRISIVLALVAPMIIAAAGCGGSSVSPVVDTVAPAPLLDVTASAVPRGVQVGWTPGSEADLAGYTVYRTQNGGAPVVMATVTGVMYTDVTVTKGQAYRYLVSAVDRSGNEGVRVTSLQVVLGSTGEFTRRGSMD
jgi:hypothetical protein